MSASMPLPLNQRLDRIGQHIVRARLFLDLWFYFEEQDSRRKIIDTMRESDEVRELTDIALEIANQLLLAGGLQNQYFNEMPREAAEAMMKALVSRDS